MLKKSFLIALVAFTTMGADWSLNSVPDTTPGGTVAGSGDALPDSSYTVSIIWRVEGSSDQTLCSKGGSTHYMQMSWDKNFSPSDDYNPPGSWPLTPVNKTLVYKLTAGSESYEDEFLCDTAP